MWFKASAPGSFMLLGEYAVLENGLAVICAIDKRITVYLSPRTDREISISSRLGKFSCDLSEITIKPPFQFVLSVINRFQKFLTKGCDITIESQFSSEVGFGSSAAVTVASITAMVKWLEISLVEKGNAKEFSPMQLIEVARSIVQEVQGLGSGADVAACVLGGVVAYRIQPFLAEQLPNTFPVSIIYSGSKMPTVTAVKRVKESFIAKPQLFQEICHGIDACAALGIDYIKQKNWHELGQVMNSQQRLMNELGVSTPELNEIIDKLHQQPDIFGAKISGSGLGDCAVALGSISERMQFRKQEIQILPTSISMRGVEYEQG